MYNCVCFMKINKQFEDVKEGVNAYFSGLISGGECSETERGRGEKKGSLFQIPGINRHPSIA